MAKSNRSKEAKRKRSSQHGVGNGFPIFIRNEAFEMEPDIMPGDMVRIDPLRKPHHEDFVFARLNDGSLLVRKYSSSMGKNGKRLPPLLTTGDGPIPRRCYESNEFTVLGVVLSVERIFYRWKGPKESAS